ncbi:hypothetical protein KAU45_00740, partial [bacterium]|nr:hypothetical protein [bacterium]
NWDLENGFTTLLRAIGKGEPLGRSVGHLASMSDGRWKRIWAYYLTLRDWLTSVEKSSYTALLRDVDPEEEVKEHIEGMLGERTELKELYVERFCRCLEFWLGGIPPEGSPQRTAHEPAAKVLEERIRELDPGGRILSAMHLEGDGRLEPCSHKAFRRYDIIVSSIGSGEWRKVMPMRGTDGFGRAALLERLITPVETWVEERGELVKDEEARYQETFALLGERKPEKVFLAAFLTSILRAQALSAIKRAEERNK